MIHRLVTKLLGAHIVAGVENHHNFAWKEVHGGKEVIVHRKGATPAAQGELGVIPGSMADPAFVVRGKGNPESLASASHGAGRQMCSSRTSIAETAIGARGEGSATLSHEAVRQSEEPHYLPST